jgi:Domain of unknown function (DUF4180)
MPARVYQLGAAFICEPDADGPALTTTDAAVTLIGDARSQGATLVAIPTSRLSEDFFRLRTGVAGAFLQKFVMYGVHIVILGNIDEAVATSAALRDFVRESNRGTAIWFCKDEKELAAKLAT